MNYIFDITDKTGRKIHLTQERWKHICIEHSGSIAQEDIIQALTIPDKINYSDRDEKVAWYYKYIKSYGEYLMVSVKYLNGEGFIITAFYTPKIQ